MNSLIGRIKILASIKDDSSDEMITIHIENSINAIIVYLNNPKLSPEEVIHNYPNAIIQLVKRQFCADTQGLNGVTSMTQGSRSESYSDAMTLAYTIDDSIKALLPKPYARLF
jgi:hypothetical protein